MAEAPGRSLLVRGRGVEVAIAAGTSRPGASVNKLFVATALVLGGRDASSLAATTVAVSELPASRYPSVTLALAPDRSLSLLELAALTLATSDNRIAHHLVTMLGPGRITAAASAIGCRDTVVAVGYADDDLGTAGRANVTSVRDCATVLDVIATDSRCAALRPALRSSLFNTRILAALPDEIVVSHKTGSLAGVVNDVGVIHAPGGDLTVCFLTEEQPDSTATSAAIGRCARAMFDATIAFDAGAT